MHFIGKKLSKISLFLFFLLLYSTFLYAAAKTNLTVGELAQNIVEPTSLFATVAYKICYVIGVVLIVGAIVQYRAHRQNPLQVRLTTPIMWLIFGIAIFLLPIIAQLSPSSEVIGQY